ncbi:MAG: hypothetical protein HYV47_01805 [Candidatus Nealsonbacteria bacterium]|nr:hypothetical protein [Candidatus Nealsonbacteria bacterium]
MRKAIFWHTALAVLQTLTGIFLASFLLFHLLGNSVINFGENAMNSYMSHLDKTTFLIKAGIWLLGIALLTHGLNGLRIVLRYFRKTSEIPGFLDDTKYRNSFLWYVHFSAGLLIAIFVAVHLALAYFGEKESVTTVELIKKRLQNDYYFILMNLFLIAVIFHACYGIRSIFVKYGFLVKHQRKISIILLILGIIFTLLGMNNLMLYGGG